MKENVVAVVAGKELTWEDFDDFLQRLPKEQRAYLSNPQAREYYLQQMISYHMFAQWGADEKLDESEEYAEAMEKARTDVLSQMAMRKVLGGVEATDEEKKAYFEENKQSFLKGATAHAKHILTDSEDTCRKILEEIQSGNKTFEDAAKEYSTCPSGQQGGDLGQFGKGQMVKEFEDAAFTGEVGTVLGPVKTQFGYHLIRVESRTGESVPDYAEVEPQIERAVLQAKQQAAYEAKTAELRERYCK